jgi:N,N'-diacetyllegionaminate synthase
MIVGNHDTRTRTFIVSEIGNNHEGNFELASEMLSKAAEAGADAVKFQTFIPELFVSPADTARMDTLRRFQLEFEEFRLLSEQARELGVLFFSTPLDMESAAFLDQIQPIYKVASGDNNYLQLIDFIVGTAKPVIISTGASTMEQLVALHRHIESVADRRYVNEEVAFLHCVSSYPVPPQQANLAAIALLKKQFPGTTIGYSDHCLGIEHAVLAVAAGAEIIEKHFTVDNDYSDFRDHRLSADPQAFRNMVNRIRELEGMMGNGEKVLQECETEIGPLIRRSLAARVNIAAGEILNSDNLVSLRPGTGISTELSRTYIGKKVVRPVRAGEFLTNGMIENQEK